MLTINLSPRQKRLSLVACSLLLLTLCACEKHSAADGSSAVMPERTTNVNIQVVGLTDLHDTIRLPGTVEAWEDLLLSTELSGVVRWIGPAEGASVKADEAILRIDPDTNRANYERALAEANLQQKKYERYSAMIAQELISRQEYDNIANDYERAKADLEVERLKLEKSTLKSPISGVLDRLLIDRGEYVAPGTPAATLVRVDRLKILVDVPEKDVSFFKPGDRVTVSYAAIDGVDGPKITGEILHLAYQADAATRTYQAKIAIDNRDGRLRPGMIVRVAFTRRTLKQVVTAPLYAVLDRDGVKSVYVEDDGTARQRRVETGLVVGDRVVIVSGLAAGERLIIKGQQLLGDGDRVVTTEE